MEKRVQQGNARKEANRLCDIADKEQRTMASDQLDYQ